MQPQQQRPQRVADWLRFTSDLVDAAIQAANTVPLRPSDSDGQQPRPTSVEEAQHEQLPTRESHEKERGSVGAAPVQVAVSDDDGEQATLPKGKKTLPKSRADKQQAKRAAMKLSASIKKTTTTAQQHLDEDEDGREEREVIVVSSGSASRPRDDRRSAAYGDRASMMENALANENPEHIPNHSMGALPNNAEVIVISSADEDHQHLHHAAPAQQPDAEAQQTNTQNNNDGGSLRGLIQPQAPVMNTLDEQHQQAQQNDGDAIPTTGDPLTPSMTQQLILEHRSQEGTRNMNGGGTWSTELAHAILRGGEDGGFSLKWISPVIFLHGGTVSSLRAPQYLDEASEAAVSTARVVLVTDSGSMLCPPTGFYDPSTKEYDKFYGLRFVARLLQAKTVRTILLNAEAIYRLLLRSIGAGSRSHGLSCVRNHIDVGVCTALADIGVNVRGLRRTSSLLDDAPSTFCSLIKRFGCTGDVDDVPASVGEDHSALHTDSVQRILPPGAQLDLSHLNMLLRKVQDTNYLTPSLFATTSLESASEFYCVLTTFHGIPVSRDRLERVVAERHADAIQAFHRADKIADELGFVMRMMPPPAVSITAEVSSSSSAAAATTTVLQRRTLSALRSVEDLQIFALLCPTLRNNASAEELAEWTRSAEDGGAKRSVFAMLQWLCKHRCPAALLIDEGRRLQRDAAALHHQFVLPIAEKQQQQQQLLAESSPVEESLLEPPAAAPKAARKESHALLTAASQVASTSARATTPKRQQTTGGSTLCRLHPKFTSLHVSTGRIMASAPNVQTLPKENKDVYGVRRAFVAPPGCVLVSFDYSQVELRVVALLSNDASLKAAFAAPSNGSVDILRRIAAMWLEKNPTDVTNAERNTSKIITYGLIFGMGADSMARQLAEMQHQPAASSAKLRSANIAPEEHDEGTLMLNANNRSSPSTGLNAAALLAQISRFRTTFHKLFPAVRPFLEEVRQSVTALGSARTAVGRPRLFHSPYTLMDAEPTTQTSSSIHPSSMDQIERQGLSTVIQGTAADLLKCAILCVHEPDDEHSSKKNDDDDASSTRDQFALLMPVHDELIFAVDARSAKATIQHLARKLTVDAPRRLALLAGIPVGQLVPFEVKCQVGPNLAQMMDYMQKI